MTSLTNPSGPTTWPATDTPLTLDTPAPDRTDLDVPAGSVAYGYAPKVDAPSAIGKAQQALDAVAGQFEKYLGSLKPERFSPDGLRQEIQRFADTDAGRTIDAAEKLAVQRRDNARENLDAVRRQLSPDGDVAAELRATRYWNRAQRILDNTAEGKLSHAAAELIDSASPAELGTLLQELVPYLTSRGIAGTALVEVALTNKAPEYARAQRKLRDAERAAATIRYNANALRDRIRNTAAPAGYRRPHMVNAATHDPDRH